MSKYQLTGLISVANKEGIVEFGKNLLDLNFGIYGSSGTARFFNEASVEAKDVASFVGGDPILNHRVVTLSRKLYAALLAKDTPEDNAELERLGISRIDLVCVDMYDLSGKIRALKPDEEIIEGIDVGGPCMLHAAAKAGRIVITDPVDRKKVIDWLREGKPDEEKFLAYLAYKADLAAAAHIQTAAAFHASRAIGI